MSRPQSIKNVTKPERIGSYFILEAGQLLLVTVSGILYNFGMLAGPYFEGQLVQRLLDIINGNKTFVSMVTLALTYLAVILIVQVMRAIKRFYVRRFANNTSRNMRHMLYNSLVNMSKAELEQEDLGTVMTKAIADVDACVEGMRKFTTEVFDTGVVLVAYLGLLFFYDWRLAMLASLFTPLAYLIAGGLKTRITRYNAAYKKSAGRLNNATMDRIGNAVTYRIYGREQNRDQAYESHLQDYEQRAVLANLWENTMQPLYNIISMCGAVLVIYFGARNVQGSGWTSWDIAAFTTFLSAFTKMALKSSKAAKLFNAVQKAQVSWMRIKPLMKAYVVPNTNTTLDFSKPPRLEVTDVSLRWPGSDWSLTALSFSAAPGQIIGITGTVASGKSTLGKAFIGEVPYQGSIRVGDRELSELSAYERSRLIAYLGHEPELMSCSLAENIRLGKPESTAAVLEAVCLEQEIAQMPEGAATSVGSGGIRLSGGQQARTALARTLYHAGAILILDDPFSAVDRRTEQAIFDHLRQLARDKIVLLISHRLSLFPELDRVLFLDNGSGIFSTHAVLLTENDAYARLYRAQLIGGEQHD